MTKNGVRETIKQELRKAGVESHEIESKETESVYYRIHLSRTTMLFRISDHATSKDVSTLRFDYRTSADKVRRYVRNRINDAKRRELSAVLNSFR